MQSHQALQSSHSLAGCPVPDVSFRPVGQLLDDGRAPVNGSVVFECSYDRRFISSCIFDPESNGLDGEWYPPLICPNMTGEDVPCFLV